MAPDQQNSTGQNQQPLEISVKLNAAEAKRPQLSTSQPAMAQIKTLEQEAETPETFQQAPVSNSVPPALDQPAQDTNYVTETTAAPVQAAAQPAPVTQQPVVESLGDQEASVLHLPLGLVAKSDISKSYRELESLNDFFHQSALRGVQPKELPAVGRVLDSLAKANSKSLLKAEDRDLLLKFLARLKGKAPVVHLSFPVEAGGEFISQLLAWFRKEIHPHIVFHIGLQPELAAGMVMRTNSKYFDFSFRKRFEKSKEKLIAALEASE